MHDVKVKRSNEVILTFIDLLDQVLSSGGFMMMEMAGADHPVIQIS